MCPLFYIKFLFHWMIALEKLWEMFFISVFLTHVGIQQMPMRLPTWKAKCLYHVGTFLPTWFILPLKNCKDILKYICFFIIIFLSSANCKQLRKCNRLYRSFFSVDIRSNQFRVIMTCYYCSVSYKNRVRRACKSLPFLKLIIP